jgi:hypothetical protein
MTPAYIVGGLIVVIAIVAVMAFIMCMPPPPAPAPVPVTMTPAVKAAEARPMPPSPPPALTATKSGSRITVSVMAGPPLAEVASFTVKLNGADVPKTLGTTAGSSVTFDGAASSNTIVVVAHYSNGSEMVVLNKSL